MLRQVTLEEIAALHESQTVEFKQSLSLRKEGLQALAGMLNADTAKGIVVFGVSPKGDVTGVEPGDLDRAQQSLAQHIGDSFDPKIVCNIFSGNALFGLFCRGIDWL